MNFVQRFSLRPFRVAESPPLQYEINGDIARSSETLSIRYSLSGSTGGIFIPAASDAPARKDGLWEETCFELFLAVVGDSRYWEFNLSPAGHWNVYRFETYRIGMEEERAYASLPFVIENRPDSLSLSLDAVLSDIVRPDESLDVGVSAVVSGSDGGPSFYWALIHCGEKADFHLRESFIIRL